MLCQMSHNIFCLICMKLELIGLHGGKRGKDLLLSYQKKKVSSAKSFDDRMEIGDV